MSQTTMFIVPEEGLWESYDYPNGFMFSFKMWDTFSKKYKIPFSLFNFKQLFDMQHDARLSREERILLHVSFDFGMVYGKDVREIIDCFVKLQDFSPHLLPMANHLRERLEKDENFIVCWQATSTSEDLWDAYEDDAYRAYDFKKDKKHWDIIKEVNEKESTIKSGTNKEV